MTILGQPEATIAPLIRALAGEGLDIDAIADRYGRAVWSCLAEPGDREAGMLCELLGPVAAADLVVHTPDPGDLVEIVAQHGEQWTEGEAEAAIKRWQPRATSRDIELALRQAARFGGSLVVPGDDDWPRGLSELGRHAPHVLWARGDRTKLRDAARSVAVVGARAATGYGEHVTVDLAGGLVDRGYAITSGGAYGIDGVAHRAALASRGITIAVMAGGIDRFYPIGHEELLGRVVEHGVVVAEVPCGTAPTKWRFLQRNRLIAAMSLATVVVEAGWRSGSLNTAHHALDLGRPVGAVPGPVTSSASAGCHHLLRESALATLVTSADDIAALAPLPGAPTPGLLTAPSPNSETATRVLDALTTRSARSSDKVAALSGLAVDRVRAELGLLELDGRVRERDGGWLLAATK